MSDDNTRKEIATVCGWEWHGDKFWDHEPNAYYWKNGNEAYRQLPNYPEDINAIKRAVGTMCEKLGWKFQEPYTNCLLLITQRRRQGCNETQKYFWMAEADSRQRCEAFIDALAILNLYTESPNVETKE
jgi:hypothetical protein